MWFLIPRDLPQHREVARFARPPSLRGTWEVLCAKRLVNKPKEWDSLRPSGGLAVPQCMFPVFAQRRLSCERRQRRGISQTCQISAKEAPRKTPRWGYEPFLWVWSANRRLEPASSSLDHRGFKMTGLCEQIFIHVFVCSLISRKNLEFISWCSVRLSCLCCFYSF